MTAVKAIAIIGLGTLLAAPPDVLSQPVGRSLRVAILENASEKPTEQYWQVFRSRLRELGYAEGKNLVFDMRYARGNAERLPALATELVERKPDVMVVGGTQATRAARQATSTIPIVFIGVGDAVGAGLVASLGRPGGNVTGLSIITGEIGVKWIELLREIVPSTKRLAYLTDGGNQGAVLVFERLQQEARKLDVTFEMFGGQQPEQLERSLEAIARQRFAGLVVGNPAILLDHRERILQFAAGQKLPAVYARREYADAGGLLSYGADQAVVYHRAAEYVQRIARGAKPAEMPVERPSTVRMVLNLKTARALGIAIPDSIRHRADDLID